MYCFRRRDHCLTDHLRLWFTVTLLCGSFFFGGGEEDRNTKHKHVSYGFRLCNYRSGSSLEQIRHVSSTTEEVIGLVRHFAHNLNTIFHNNSNKTFLNVVPSEIRDHFTRRFVWVHQRGTNSERSLWKITEAMNLLTLNERYRFFFSIREW